MSVRGHEAPFEQWARERINVAREEAMQHSITVGLALLRAQWMDVNEILEKFPDIVFPMHCVNSLHPVWGKQAIDELRFAQLAVARAWDPIGQGDGEYVIGYACGPQGGFDEDREFLFVFLKFER